MKLTLSPLILPALLSPWSAIRCPLTCSMCEKPADTPQSPPALEETLSLLHTSKEAEREQHMRLRKQKAPDPETEDTEPVADPVGPTVHLVGVGPGDVELLTLKALRVMGSADLVLYDRLISPEILKLVNPDAAMLYVGKESGLHTRKQEEIHELLLQFAQSGKSVCRLKGGDPTVFGRGGEEMEYLEANGVPVAVVPGITAASGIAAGLGVPLTHRDHADAVRFVTGHARSECTEDVASRYSWEVLADPKCTLVIYMGLSTLPELVEGLLGAGLDSDTPAVAVQDGTTPTQRVVSADLANLHDQVSTAGLRSPTLVIIGQVVSLLKDRSDIAAQAFALANKSGGATVALTAEQVAQEISVLRQRK